MLCEPAYRISQQLKKTIASLEETNILLFETEGKNKLPNPILLSSTSI